MPVHNADIAAAFAAIADLLEIRGDNPFRIRAYRNAVRVVREFPQDIKSLFDHGRDLPKLPGIGPDLHGKIHEICDSGTCALLTRLQREVPPALAKLLQVPGLGPQRAKLLHDSLAVNSIEDLQRAARAGRIRDVPGFGEKSEAQILQSVLRLEATIQRFPLAVATQYATALAAHLERTAGVIQVTVAGSYRRARETVGDLDILVSARAGAPVMARFAAYDEVAQVLTQGEARASVRLKSGLQVDLRLVAPESYGAALHYFTGSKAHNIALRKLAQARGLKLNEYGLFRGNSRLAGDTEESVFRALGLAFIPPELREDRGEIEAAAVGKLPQLVRREDLRGDLHVHTTASDGRHSIADMIEAARKAGLEYLAITEHSRRLSVARGLDPVRLRKQMAQIDRINDGLKRFHVFKGIEVDILEDGTLDLPDNVLRDLDIVIGAVHSHFGLPLKRQTERIIRAINQRYFTVLAHPAGRLLGQREALELDWPRILRAARARGCFVEVNAQPERMDLDDVHSRMALEEGVPVVINSDAHSVFDFNHLLYGIGQARRGWIGPDAVVNTRTLAEILRLLAAVKGRAVAA
jgi:DNA polymerase (family 10)